MNGLGFFDTNILVYADDASSPRKQRLAIELIAKHQRSGLVVVSLQVLQEYFAAATRKLRVDPASATHARKTALRKDRMSFSTVAYDTTDRVGASSVRLRLIRHSLRILQSLRHALLHEQQQLSNVFKRHRRIVVVISEARLILTSVRRFID
jgi:predicted nucleic acid-binding protein